MSVQVPELAALNKSQRRLVVRGAFQLLREAQPAAAALAGLPGLGAIFGFFAVTSLFSFFHIGNSVVSIGGGIVGAIVGAKVGAHIFRGFMRPYYRRFIEGHQDEIRAAA